MDDDDPLDIREAMNDDDEPQTSAIGLLTEDHDELRQVFQDYAALGDSEPARAAKQSLLDGLLQLLEVHLAVEEDVFYPAVRDALDDPELARVALAEHAEIDELIRELRRSTPQGAALDARMHTLQSLVEGHIDTVERELFPLTEDVFEDVDSLCQQMRERKEEAESEHGRARTEPEPAASDPPPLESPMPHSPMLDREEPELGQEEDITTSPPAPADSRTDRRGGR